jgi:hypothetical protein
VSTTLNTHYRQMPTRGSSKPDRRIKWDSSGTRFHAILSSGCCTMFLHHFLERQSLILALSKFINDAST